VKQLGVIFKIIFICFPIFATNVKNLNVSSGENFTLVLNWEIEGTLENSYPHILRKAEYETEWHLIDWVDQQTTYYVDSELNINTEYCYIVYLDDSNGPFGGSNEACAKTSSVMVTSPNGGETWLIGEAISITWIDELNDNVNINLYKGGTWDEGGTKKTIIWGTESDGSEIWTIPEDIEPGTDYKIQVKGVNNIEDETLMDYSDNFFEIIGPVKPIINNNPNDITLNEGKTATFTCEFNGPRNKGYRWHRIKPTWLELQNEGRYSGTDSPTLSISNVTLADSGSTYLCEAKDLDWYFINPSTGDIYKNAWTNSEEATLTVNQIKYSISASVSPSGSGTINGTGEYDTGATVSLTASASTGYKFVNWTENGTQVSTNSTYEFVATRNRTLVANFLQNSYIISTSVNPSGGGTASGAGTYNHGSSVSLTTTTTTGYRFVNWTENDTQVSEDSTFAFIATSSRSLVANFALIELIVTPDELAFGQVVVNDSSSAQSYTVSEL